LKRPWLVGVIVDFVRRVVVTWAATGPGTGPHQLDGDPGRGAPGACDDATEVTATQIREVVERIRVPGSSSPARPTSWSCSTPATT